jgi:DNA repair protein RadC
MPIFGRLAGQGREHEFYKSTLLDHVIVGQPVGGQSGYFSFKEAGVL